MLRRLTALLLTAVLLLSALTACGTKPVAEESGETDASLAEETAPQEEETPAEADVPSPITEVGIAYQSTGSLHPYTSESVTNQAVMSLLYESMFIVGSDFAAYPLLCASCAVSEDGTVWHFDLRQDITFSDGSAMTAADVAASLSAARTSSLYQTRFDIVTGIEQDGAYGVIVRLTTACENLPLLLDVPIVKAGTVSSGTPVGSGPYVCSGDSLVRNTNWWQDATPTIDVQKIRLVAANDPQAVRDAFEFGGADIAYSDPSASNAADYHCDYELWSAPTTTMLYLGFNLGSNYFYSSTLRGGITYAVDRETILTQIYGGFGLAAALPCSPLASFYDGALAASYTYDPGSFQACLSSSGIWPDPAQPLRFIVSDVSARRVSVANLIAEELQSLGLYTEVVVCTEEEFQFNLINGNFDMYLAEIRLPPNFDLRCFFKLYSTADYGGTGGDSALQLCNQALENSGNYYDLFRTVMNRGLLCPILFKTNAFYTTRGVMKAHTTTLSNLFAELPAQTLADILSETPYEAPPATEPDEPDEPDNPDDPGAGGDPDAPADPGEGGADPGFSEPEA